MVVTDVSGAKYRSHL